MRCLQAIVLMMLSLAQAIRGYRSAVVFVSTLRPFDADANMQNWQQVCAEMNHAEEWHTAAVQSAELGGAVIGRLFCELQVLRLEVNGA